MLKRYSLPHFHLLTPLIGVFSFLKIKINPIVIKNWGRSGFKTLSDFLVSGTWLSVTEMSARIGGNFLLIGSYSNLIYPMLAQLDPGTIANHTSTLVLDLFINNLEKKPGVWKQCLTQSREVELTAKVIRKWYTQENFILSPEIWKTINQFNFCVLRGANWGRMLYFSKWLLYRTPVIIAKMYNNASAFCFRHCNCEQANWSHIIMSCPKIKHFWEEIIGFLKTYCLLSVPCNATMLLFGYDPDCIFSSHLAKLIYIIMAVARSLLLQNWLSSYIPTLQEWLEKMKRVRKSELLYAQRVGGIRKFDQIWGCYFE